MISKIQFLPNMRNIMKKIIAIATLVVATSASAGFFNKSPSE
jgi:hypothetical protein